MHHLPQHPATPTRAFTSANHDVIQLHAQAVNGLNAALRFLTHPSIEADSKAFTLALARAMRATTALKRACTAMNEVAA